MRPALISQPGTLITSQFHPLIQINTIDTVQLLPSTLLKYLPLGYYLCLHLISPTKHALMAGTLRSRSLPFRVSKVSLDSLAIKLHMLNMQQMILFRSTDYCNIFAFKIDVYVPIYPLAIAKCKIASSLCQSPLS